jgi:hypothetical protein
VLRLVGGCEVWRELGRRRWDLGRRQLVLRVSCAMLVSCVLDTAIYVIVWSSWCLQDGDQLWGLDVDSGMMLYCL